MTGAEANASMPERVGRYELLFPVGTGGMGTVYLARAETVPGVMRNVAVKLMHSELRANPEIAPQLMVEAKLAARIVHPNVVAVLEAGESAYGVYLAMEYIEGTTLAGLLRKARKREELLPLRVAGRIIRDALTGLHAAHELKDDEGRPLDIVHRDFSPHNILVGTDGISRLTDFGIAKALSQLGTTATGVVKGKIGYMAPEQARGERIDRRSDVWAAGVVTWETLTAKRLFRGGNDAATLLQIVSGKRPPPVSRVRAEVPAGVGAAVDEALTHEVKMRISTAQELRRRLEQGLAEIGGVADEDEVAEYVRELVEEDLQKSRERARNVLRLRNEIAEMTVAPQEVATGTSSLGSPPPIQAFRPPSPSQLPTSEMPATSPADAKATADEIDPPSHTRAAMTAVTEPIRAKSRYWVWAAALAAGAVASLALTYGGLFGSSSASPTPPSASASASGAVAAAPSTPAVPSEPTSPTAAAPPGTLKVTGDAPFDQLKLDGRTIVLPEPASELEVPLRGATPKRLVARTPDGRRVEVALKEDQSMVELRFPEAPRVRPRTFAPPVPQPTDDGLADSPYGAK